MEVKVTIPPVEMPLSLQEVKDYIKVDYDNDDAIIIRLINAVTRSAELYTGLSFVTRQLACYYTNTGPFELPYGPHQSIDEVVRINYDKTEVPLTSEEYSYSGMLYYKMDGGYHGGCQIAFGFGSIRCGQSFKLSSPWGDMNKMRVTYTAGFGDASQVPDLIKQAILKEVAELYENRENTVTGTIVSDLSTTTKDYLYQYKRNVLV